jgi:hypothetical protein
MNRSVSCLGIGTVSNKIPSGIARQHVVEAIRDLDQGASNPFGEFTGCDVLFEGHRYAPKALHLEQLYQGTLLIK